MAKYHVIVVIQERIATIRPPMALFPADVFSVIPHTATWRCFSHHTSQGQIS